MANEQVESSTLESNDLAGLADFLSDTPDTQEPEEESSAQQEDESTGDADNEDSSNDEQDIDPDAPDGEDEDEPAPVAKITFKVKNADGQEETVEATTEEIAKSYMRQADFTKKTQALAARENEAVQFLTQKHDEIRNQYVSQAEVSRAAVAQMAGLKSESQMAELANSDPAAWVAENQRQRQINSFLNQLDNQINGEKQQAHAQQEQRSKQALKQAFDSSWEELTKAKIDKATLAKIYGDASKNYGFSNEELGNVYDHRLVKMMRDATAYQALKAAKPGVTKQVQNAPRMPSRQAQPEQARRDQALNNKFKNGSAKLNDLAAFLR